MQTYLILKWLHIVAVISWLAGILYLLRLFIYHSEWGTKSSDNHDMLVVMERRLMYYITHPAMGFAWLAGLGMIMLNPILMKQGWFHTKLLCVVLLTAMTIFSGRLHRRLKNKENVGFSSRQLRFLNEVPTLLMVIIVGLVVLRPL
jgi:putative membrane protein